MKRVELADKLQGIDYVYTIQGWLKSINHPEKANDPGKDTDDAFGMQLDYFSGDYTRTGSQISFTTSPQAAAAQYHSGTITGQHWRSEGTLVGTQSGAYTYSYDPRYQLSETQFGSVANGIFTPNGTVYKESNLTYDWNGNIQSLKRYDAKVPTSPNTTVEPIHNFTYQYLQKNNLPTNQLASIPNYGSYQYDQLGQLEHEQLVGKPDRYYSYEVSGKVSGLYADANKTQPKVQFGYDAIGQRLYKYSSESQLTTYYVRDASGNVLAIYEKTGNTNPIQQEIPIYGSGRLGTLNVLARSYVYELRDHLGNVRVVVGKVNGSLDIFSQSDYYALGSVLRRSGRDYRYGYQGMYAEEDKETGKNSFELRMYDAVIGRWLSIDPAREFPSPYVAMGNDWIKSIDPDGGKSFDQGINVKGEVVYDNKKNNGNVYLVDKGYNEKITSLDQLKAHSTQVVKEWVWQKNSAISVIDFVALQTRFAYPGMDFGKKENWKIVSDPESNGLMASGAVEWGKDNGKYFVRLSKDPRGLDIIHNPGLRDIFLGNIYNLRSILSHEGYHFHQRTFIPAGGLYFKKGLEARNWVEKNAINYQRTNQWWGKVNFISPTWPSQTLTKEKWAESY